MAQSKEKVKSPYRHPGHAAGVPDSSKELSLLTQRRIWLRPVLTVQDRVQEQIMDAGLGTEAKMSFDSLAKSIYTLPDEGKDQFLYAQWP